VTNMRQLSPTTWFAPGVCDVTANGEGLKVSYRCGERTIPWGAIYAAHVAVREAPTPAPLDMPGSPIVDRKCPLCDARTAHWVSAPGRLRCSQCGRDRRAHIRNHELPEGYVSKALAHKLAVKSPRSEATLAAQKSHGGKFGSPTSWRYLTSSAEIVNADKGLDGVADGARTHDNRNHNPAPKVSNDEA